jgi:hypothetical protein
LDNFPRVRDSFLEGQARAALGRRKAFKYIGFELLKERGIAPEDPELPGVGRDGTPLRDSCRESSRV